MNRPIPKHPSTPATDAPNHMANQGDDAMHQLVAETDADAPARANAVPWRVQAVALRDETSERIRAQPMRSMLIAVGAGAALALLAGVLSR